MACPSLAFYILHTRQKSDDNPLTAVLSTTSHSGLPLECDRQPPATARPFVAQLCYADAHVKDETNNVAPLNIQNVVLTEIKKILEYRANIFF